MSHQIVDQVGDSVITDEEPTRDATRQVLTNPRFMALFLSQVLTQVGGNMVLFGLTIKVFDLTGTTTSVSILLLTFLVPAVVFGAIAGVFVDRFDRRWILIGTNMARGALFLSLAFLPEQLWIIYLVTAIVATLTTFFAPAEAAMIPFVVKHEQLMTANGLFILALQASFVLGFAVLGPLAQNILGTQALIVIVAAAYGLAGLLCGILPSAPPTEERSRTLRSAGSAVASTMSQLREGLGFIRRHRNIGWSLTYLAVTSSLIGVVGVLGPDFAVSVLGLGEDDFVIVVLPLGVGLVIGILVLNFYGRLMSRRRLIESGMIALGLALVVLGLAQKIDYLTDGTGAVSLLAVVIAVAFAAGVCYAFVAVPAQTSLQEELPSDVRGRVFGVLNMLVSLASFVPIIIVGPLADAIGSSTVIVLSALIVGAVGVFSIFFAHPAVTGSARPVNIEPVDPMTVTTSSSTLNRPVRLRYMDTDTIAPIQLLASPVVPGRAGPAPEDAADIDDA